MLPSNLYFLFHELLICDLYKAFLLGSLPYCFLNLYSLHNLFYMPFQDNFGLRESDYLNEEGSFQASLSFASSGIHGKSYSPWGSRKSGFLPMTIFN